MPLALAQVRGSKAWFVAEAHGGLPNNGKVIEAVVDLLRDGTTKRLPGSHRTASRAGRMVPESVLRRVAPRKVRWQDLSPDARRRLLEPVVSPEFHGAVSSATLRATAPQVAAPSTGRRPIEIRLSPGSIVDASARALVLGVFRNVDPSGAAAAVDERLGGAVREFTLRRMFSGQLGQVFMLPSGRAAMLAEFVLFAGLGDFDDFGSEAQSFVAENVVRTLARTHVQDFATVLFGTGSGIPVATALEQQLKGFLDGLRLADRDRVVRRVTICEIDPRRFAALRRAVRSVVARLAGEDLVVVVDEAAPSAEEADRGRPARKSARRTGATTDPAYLLVTMTGQGRGAFECRSSLLTAGAKAAVLSGLARIDRSELDATLGARSPGELSGREMARFGSDIARLMLPRAVREGLDAMSRRPLVIVHDREASRVPWESLRIGDTHPALERGLSRRYASENLSVARWREDRHTGDRTRVMMVVNPTLDLPGAAREGATLREALLAAGTQVDCLEGREASRSRLLHEIGSGDNDILHFAGHAFFDAGEPRAQRPRLRGGRRALRLRPRAHRRPAVAGVLQCLRGGARAPAGRSARAPAPAGIAKVEQPRRGVPRRWGRELRRHSLARRRRGRAGLLDALLPAIARRRPARGRDAGSAAPRLRHRLERLGRLRVLRQSAVPRRPARRRERNVVHITATSRTAPHEMPPGARRRSRFGLDVRLKNCAHATIGVGRGP